MPDCTPREFALDYTAEGIAKRVRSKRLCLSLTQEELAERSGVKLSAYRRFEQTGEISLQGLLMVAEALNCLRDFDDLFAGQTYRTLDDVIAEATQMRKRGATSE